MYSARSFYITKQEYNYLLPVLKNKLLVREKEEKNFIISNDIQDLTDILNRLKGLYNYYNDINPIIVYYCSEENSLKRFRELL